MRTSVFCFNGQSLLKLIFTHGILACGTGVFFRPHLSLAALLILGLSHLRFLTLGTILAIYPCDDSTMSSQRPPGEVDNVLSRCRFIETHLMYLSCSLS